jgi:hypothetical protein
MEIQIMGGVIGVVCLGLASLAAFLMVPARELSMRERIGIHTFYWAFAVYATWTIYFMSSARGWEKYFYVCIPLMLGLILSLLSELQSKQPPISIGDVRLKKIAVRTWHRLPNHVKRGLQSTVMNIQEVPEWSELDLEYFQDSGVRAARWTAILPLPARGIIHISESDCLKLQDQSIIEAMAHELGIAYQSTRTPFDSNAIEKAGNELPVKWNFKSQHPR